MNETLREQIAYIIRMEVRRDSTPTEIADAILANPTLAPALSAAERVEWRPIKTAPGSAFDWDSDLGDADAGIAIARDEDNGEPLFFVWYEFEDGVSTPTKWRPLVEGPTARVPQDPEQGR